MSETVSLQQRRRTLDEALRSLTQTGWVISSQTETTAQLFKSGQKSGCLIVVLLVFGILPGILYAVWPASQQTLFVIVDEQGRARFSGSSGVVDPILQQEQSFRASLRRKEARLEILWNRRERATQKRDRAEERSGSIARWTGILLGLLSTAISLAYLECLANWYLQTDWLDRPLHPPVVTDFIPVAVPWLISLFLIIKRWNPVLGWWKRALKSLEKEIPVLEAQIRALRISLKRGF